MTNVARAYLRLISSYVLNPLSETTQLEVREFYRHLGAERDEAQEVSGAIYNLAKEDTAPLETPAIESTGEHWDPNDDGWSYQQYDTASSSQRVRRMSVPSGWLYQVELANFEDPISAESGRRLSGWHPPVFVPAPDLPVARITRKGLSYNKAWRDEPKP